MKPGGLDLTWLVNDFESFLSQEARASDCKADLHRSSKILQVLSPDPALQIDFTGERANAEAAVRCLAHRNDVMVPPAPTPTLPTPPCSPPLPLPRPPAAPAPTAPALRRCRSRWRSCAPPGCW